MSWIDIVILLAAGVAIAFAIRQVIKNKRKTGCAGGCSGCTACQENGFHHPSHPSK